MDKVAEETNYRVHITPYWGGVLINASEASSQLKQGVFDIGWVGNNYEKSGFELTTLYSIYFLPVTDMDLRARISDEVRVKFPELDEEFSDMKRLGTWGAGSDLVLATVDTPINTLEDFRGMVLRVYGVVGTVLKELGSEAAGIPMGEVYGAFEKKMIDGGVLPKETLIAFDFAKIINYIGINVGGGPNPNDFMNMDTWNSLPPDIQQVFDDNIEFWGETRDALIKVGDKAGIEYARESGVDFVEMPQSEIDQWTELCWTVLAQEAAKLDAKGYRATDILNEVQTLYKKYK